MDCHSNISTNVRKSQVPSIPPNRGEKLRLALLIPPIYKSEAGLTFITSLLSDPALTLDDVFNCLLIATDSTVKHEVEGGRRRFRTTQGSGHFTVLFSEKQVKRVIDCPCFGVEQRGCPCLIGTNTPIRYKKVLEKKQKFNRVLSRDTGLTISEFFCHYDTVRGVIASAGLSPRQTDAVMMVVRWHLVSGICFASAKYIGHSAGLSEKAVDRLIRRLAESGLIHRRRVLRADLTLGTNILDPGPLLSLVKKALARLMALPRWAVRHIRQRVTILAHGCAISWRVHVGNLHACGEGWLNLGEGRAGGY